MSFRPEIHSLALAGLIVGLLGCQAAHPKATFSESEATRSEPEAMEGRPQESLPRAEQADDSDPPIGPAESDVTISISAIELISEQEPQFDLSELQALAVKDPELALKQLDTILLDQPNNGPLQLLFADATLNLFKKKQLNGKLSPSLATDLLSDAFDAYTASLATNETPLQSRAGLVRCHSLQGDSEASWTAALDLYQQITAQIESGEKIAEGVLTTIGKAGLAQTIARVQSQEPPPNSIHLAVLCLQTAFDQGGVDAALPLSDLQAWLGDPNASIDALALGLENNPGDLALFARLQNLGGNNRKRQVSLLEQLRLKSAGHAAPLWYLGEARYLQGREARVAGDYLKASECWDRAEESFLQAMALEPSYATTCQQWLHLVRTQRGWTLRDEGRTTDAAAVFLSTLEADSTRLEPESSAESLHLGIDAITGDYYNSDNLKQARHFLRKVCALHDSNSDWTNNLGFFCRDLGVQALADDNRDSAQQYFEESWDAYSRTVELSPAEARLVNDRALISVYYLDEHWELAEQELHRAIALGQQTLSEMDSDVPKSEQEYFDMAVGDAWENLAYLYLNRYQEIGDSETYLKNSLEHFPFEQRTGIPPLRLKLEELRKRSQ